MKSIKALALLAVCLPLASPLAGVDTSFWQVGTFDEFLQGTLQNVSLTKEGELKLAPEAKMVFNPEEALALSLTADHQGNFYIGTGHLGKVFRVDAKQRGSLFFTAEESDIFALAAGPNGDLYVGSSPEGKIYRVTPDGKSSVFYDPEAKYIWALAFDARGNLFAGTGDQGRILKIDPAGKSEVFFDSKQTHIMCLTFDPKGNLLAGSVPNGLVYRIDPAGKAFVLYQDTLPEIHALAVDSRGRIYAAALGGAGGKGSQQLLVSPPGTQQVAPVTTVTVTAGAGEAAGTPEAQQPPQVATATTPSLKRPAPQTTGFNVPQIPQGRGSLVQILPDYSTETLWTSNNESIFGLAVRDNQVLFSTDSNGRVFDLTPSPDGQKLTLLTATQESLATRLMLRGSDLYIATSNIGKLFRVGSAVGHEGSFESPVKDGKTVSRWGTLTWRGEAPAGTTVEFYTRSGNSDRPDQTWSDWAGPYTNPAGSAIASPPARYLQWKAVLRAASGGSPQLNEVTISYVNQNLPPQIRSLDVSTSGERTGPAGTSSTSAAGATSTVTVTSISALSYPTPSTPNSPNPKPTTISWKADDPNGDTLVYTLQVRAADEEEWHLVKDKLQQTNYTLDPNSLADGKYVARLIASDEGSNPPETARSSELVSAPFWLDSTPPQVRAVKQEVTAQDAEVVFQAEDATSPLSQAETSLDGAGWQAVRSDDGIVDTRSETFTVRTRKLDPGEHVLTLRATDTAGNVGVGKAVIRIPAPSGAGR